MQVYTYPESERVEFGAVRFKVEWDTVKVRAQGKTTSDFNPDADVDYHARAFGSEPEATRFARQTFDHTSLCFGVVTIQKQVVDWFVEEDRIAEWSNVGEPTYIDA